MRTEPTGTPLIRTGVPTEIPHAKGNSRTHCADAITILDPKVSCGPAEITHMLQNTLLPLYIKEPAPFQKALNRLYKSSCIVLELAHYLVCVCHVHNPTVQGQSRYLVAFPSPAKLPTAGPAGQNDCEPCNGTESEP